jgi:hypothetical protein
MSKIIKSCTHLLAAVRGRMVVVIVCSFVVTSCVAIAVASASQAISDPVNSTSEVTPTEAAQIATQAARAAGDDGSIELVSVATNVEAGVRAVLPEGAAPSANVGISQLGSGSAYVEVMRGHFNLDVPRPENAPEPTGTVLSMVVRASGGSVAFRALNDSNATAAAIEKLGVATRTNIAAQ